MRVHDALGKAGSAAGVIDRDTGILVQWDRPGLSIRPEAGSTIEEGFIVRHNMFHGSRRYQGMQFRVHYQHPGATVFDDPAQLLRREARIEHHHHRTDEHRAVVRFERRRAVGREYGHTVARAHSEIRERRCEPIYALVEQRVGEAPFTLHHGDSVAEDGGAAGEKVEGCERSDHNDPEEILPV
jgi:hypothetical protein